MMPSRHRPPRARSRSCSAPIASTLTVGPRSLHIADRRRDARRAQAQKQERRASVKLAGTLVVARGWPREAFGHLGRAGPAPRTSRAADAADVRRRAGGPARRRRPRRARKARRPRAAFAHSSRPARRRDPPRRSRSARGHALDKVLLADHGDRYAFYARRLFRDRARFAMEVHAMAASIVPEGKVARRCAR